jgi:hypothetical protein
MRLFKSNTEATQEPDLDLAAETGHVEKNPLPVHNEGTAQPLSIDHHLERQVVRKLDINLVPLVMALCVLFHLLPYLGIATCS